MCHEVPRRRVSVKLSQHRQGCLGFGISKNSQEVCSEVLATFGDRDSLVRRMGSFQVEAYLLASGFPGEEDGQAARLTAFLGRLPSP